MELMVAVGIMGVIVAALYTVFNQTQKALRANANQTDVLEGGRFAMEQVVGDLRRLSAAGLTPETNFLVSLSPAIQALPVGELDPKEMLLRYYDTNPPADFGAYLPLVQRLDVPGMRRTNTLQEFFLFARNGTRTLGTSYRVINAQGGVGTLAKYSFEYTHRLMLPGLLSVATLGQYATNFSQLLDGVIHFRVQAYDAMGYAMAATNRFWYLDSTTNTYANPGYQLGVDLLLDPDARSTTETFTVFRSNALPAAVEVELGVLDPDALAQFRQLPEGSALARSFLSNRAAQVQLFRQRIPIWQAPPLQSVQSARP
jgi:type II secretory pathway pseudopilin PulG